MTSMPNPRGNSIDLTRSFYFHHSILVHNYDSPVPVRTLPGVETVLEAVDVWRVRELAILLNHDLASLLGLEVPEEATVRLVVSARHHAPRRELRTLLHSELTHVPGQQTTFQVK